MSYPIGAQAAFHQVQVSEAHLYPKLDRSSESGELSGVPGWGRPTTRGPDAPEGDVRSERTPLRLETALTHGSRDRAVKRGDPRTRSCTQPYDPGTFHRRKGSDSPQGQVEGPAIEGGFGQALPDPCRPGEIHVPEKTDRDVELLHRCPADG